MVLHDPHADPAADAPASPQVVLFPVNVDVTNSDAVGEALRAAFRPGVSLVIADMSATEFCDSAAIRHLILVSNQAARTGGELRIVISSPAVVRVLHVLEADQVLRLYPDMAAAKTATH